MTKSELQTIKQAMNPWWLVIYDPKPIEKELRDSFGRAWQTLYDAYGNTQAQHIANMMMIQANISAGKWDRYTVRLVLRSVWNERVNGRA